MIFFTFVTGVAWLMFGIGGAMILVQQNRLRPLMVTLLTLLLAAPMGCVKTLQPGPLNQVQPVSDEPRAGNVYLVRGFIGVFSAGVDAIAEQLKEMGVRAHVYQDDQWPALARRMREAYRHVPDAEPLVLIGHSYGADDVIRIARELDKANVPVDLLVTLDPVTPRPVPKNVRYALNIYQSNRLFDNLPFLRGVALRTDRQFAGELANFHIKKDRQDLLEPRTSHFNIEKKSKVREEVVDYVLMICPPRETWLASGGKRPPAAGAGSSEVSAGNDDESGAAQPAGHRLGN